MKFTVPGKTYLVGEYSVLLGGSALGLATRPCFEIEIDIVLDQETSQNPAHNLSVEQSQLKGEILHPDSPAGRYLKKHNKKITIAIKDPYLNGGFGRSTAEYWAAMGEDLLNADLDFGSTLEEYKSMHSGSGIDLAFQYYGNICLADPLIHFYQTFSWHFENLDFYILSTGLKISTHEHLKNLDLSLLKELPVLSNRITTSYAENKEFEFLSLMKQWCAMLEKHNLTHAHSLKMKAELESFESIKLAKPCGALGADVIIVFFAKSHKETVKNYLEQNNYKVQAHSSDLSQGVQSQIEILRLKKLDSEKPITEKQGDSDVD